MKHKSAPKVPKKFTPNKIVLKVKKILWGEGGRTFLEEFKTESCIFVGGEALLPCRVLSLIAMHRTIESIGDLARRGHRQSEVDSVLRGEAVVDSWVHAK